MWFRSKPSPVQESVDKLQQEIHEYQLREHQRQLEQHLIILKDKQFNPGIPVRENVATIPGNMPASFNVLQNFSDLTRIPALIRNIWSYRTPVVLTIVHQDYVRWIGRMLYEQCPTIQGVIQCLSGLIYGSTGIQFTCYSKQVGRNIKLVERVQKFIDDVVDFNNINEWQIEAHNRIHSEGEVFIRVATDTRDQDNTNLPLISIIEPDFIRPSQKYPERMDHEDPNVSMAGTNREDWSFGIHNKKWQYYAPDAFNIVWPNTEEEVVSADDMFHYANRKARNHKRGLPSYFAIIDDLIQATVLRAAFRQGAMVRASVAGVVQHETAPSDVVASNIRDAATGSVTKVGDSATPYSVSTTDISPGSFLHINKGLNFVPGPEFPDSQSLSLVYDQTLECIGNFYTLPASMLSGRGSQQSFAGSLVEENPGTKRREREQSSIAEFWEKIIKRCVLGDAARLNLPEDVWEVLGIQAKGPAIVARDRLSETQEHETRVAAGIESKATWQQAAGLDPEEEEARIDDESQTDPAAGQTLDKDDKKDVKATKTIGGMRSRIEK